MRNGYPLRIWQGGVTSPVDPHKDSLLPLFLPHAKGDRVGHRPDFMLSTLQGYKDTTLLTDGER